MLLFTLNPGKTNIVVCVCVVFANRKHVDVMKKRFLYSGGFQVRAIKLSTFPCAFLIHLKNAKIIDTTILAKSNSFQIAFLPRSGGPSWRPHQIKAIKLFEFSRYHTYVIN